MSKRDVGCLVPDRIRAQNPPAKSLKLCLSADARQQHAMFVKRLGVPELESDWRSFGRGKPRPNCGGLEIVEFVLSAEGNVNRNEVGLNGVQ